SSKNLVTEVKEMKEIFKSMEAEVDQNVIDLRSGEIERENLLIINENLIAKCIAQDVFYIVTYSTLTTSQFHELSTAYNVAQTRAPLKSQNFQLHDTINKLQKENDCFQAENSKIKQHYKELYDLIKITHATHIEKITSLLNEIETLKTQVKGKMSVIPNENMIPKVSVCNKYAIDVELIPTSCSKHMVGDRSRLRNFMKNFIRTVRFGNNHFGAIMGYGDYVISDNVIFRVYYVEGLGHNLFFVDQFCDSYLEVAFRKHSCFVRDLDGVDLIKSTRGTKLYTIYVEDIMRSYPICLLSKASKNKSWLWHRRLNHLNFGTINDLARKDLVCGLPRLNFKKYHLCSACQLGKSKKYAHKTKTINTIMEVLHTLHMDLCGPMRVRSINGKKYILIIVDDYFRFTWVKFLRNKDETLEVIIKLIKRLQIRLNKTVKNIRTDNGTEFINQHLIQYNESVGISHQKSISRTPQQNSVVER
nr:retrovirus-related Pol polyprotein from transposon TNT 1-94 [Tanacetum cinerariifolium]